MCSIPSLPSNFDSFNPRRDIDLFNPSLSCPDSEIRHFNDVTSFLRNLEHCQKLYRYRRTKLLEYMLWALNDSVWKWFKKQSHFNSLSRFDMILTKAFSSQEQRELKSIAQKRAKRKAQKIAERAELNVIETAKQTSTLQNIDIFDSTACDESEFGLYNEVANFLQHLQQCQHRYRKTNLLNLLSESLCDLAFEWFKTQSEFISLKRFSRALTKAFSSAEIFSRRVSSRSSNLQLCTLVAISKSMKNASNQLVIQMNCKICKQDFNFNEKLYEHIRNHEAQKFVKNSHLSINAVNLVCEIEKRSLASQKSHDSFTRSQKSIFESAVAFEAVTLLKRSTLQSLALETTSESTKRLSACRHCKQTFNFKKMLRQHKREQHAKRSVDSSHLLIDAAKSTCESMKISTVNSSSSDSLAVQSKQMSKLSIFFESIVSFKSSSLITLSLLASLDSFNSTRSHQNSEKRRFNQIVFFIQHLQQCQHLYCESELLDWMKVVLCDSVDIWFENQSIFIFLHDFDIALTKAFSTFIFTHVSSSSFAKSQNSIFESTATFKSVISSERSNLSLSTLKTELESAKRSATCRHCKQTFKFKELLRKHKREQHAKKSVINSSLRFHALKSVCKAEKKSVVKNVTTLLASQELQTSVQKSQKIDVQKHSAVSSSLTSSTSETICEFVEKSAVTCSSFSQKSSISSATSRNLVTDTKISLQFVSLKSSHLSITTSKITSKDTKTTSDLSAEDAKSIANIRAQTAHIRVRMKAERAALQISALESASKSMKRLSIQQIACARICKRCKQDFNFNNKLHEHIRKHHARKSVRSLNLRVFASELTYKIIEKSASICSSASLASQKSFILSATSRSRIFYSATIFRSMSSIRLNLSIASHEVSSKRAKIAAMLFTRDFTSKRVEIAAFNCSLTSSTSSSRTSVSKSYLTMNDLSRMFHEKSKSFDVQQHQNRCRSSQSFDLRQFSQSCSTSSKKSYLSIENLFEMFDEKFRRKNMFQNQRNVSSREFFSEQSRIIAYFKSAINRKSLISQNSKSSKSKSWDQHMSAKSFRIVFNKDVFEKSIKLSYKMSDVFCTNLKSSVETSFFIFILLRLLSIFLLALAFVSIVSAARMSCISVCEQVISIIDDVNIEFVASKRSWEETRDRLLEYLVTKHQKFESSTLYIQNHISDLEEASSRSSAYFIIYVIVCIFCELTADQSLYQLQWFRSSISRINLHSSSKYRYLYSHRKSDKSESLSWSETQSVEQSSRLDQSASRFSNFRYFQMIYHITYSQISWLMSRSQTSNWNSRTFSSFLLCICINH